MIECEEERKEPPEPNKSESPIDIKPIDNIPKSDQEESHIYSIGERKLSASSSLSLVSSGSSISNSQKPISFEGQKSSSSSSQESLGNAQHNR